MKARAAAVWEARRGFAEEHRTGAARLAARCHVPKGDAQRTLRLGRACRHLPVAEEAWLAGDVTGHHLSLLASRCNDRTAERMTDDERRLVDHARRLTFRFTRAPRHGELGADPDGTDRDAAASHDSRRVHLSQSFEDRWALDGTTCLIRRRCSRERLAITTCRSGDRRARASRNGASSWSSGSGSTGPREGSTAQGRSRISWRVGPVKAAASGLAVCRGLHLGSAPAAVMAGWGVDPSARAVLLVVVLFVRSRRSARASCC